MIDVSEWLTALGSLCAGTMTQDEATTKIMAYTPMLRHEFRAEAFTATTLAHVARGCKFFPAFSEICTLLAAWVHVHPIVTDHLRLSDQRARDFHQSRSEAARDWSQPDIVMRAAKSLDGHPMRDILSKMLGALVMRHAMRNVSYLPPEFHPPEAQERLEQSFKDAAD